ncbi:MULTISPECIES: hypothetical protein [unclassified Streptomyces]|uniref:hypothetical protein n=1 Tax=unclassified Streptomyces TaxID=2593676 RepID=UPI002E31B54C|nr:hypothetical protein [Streptomyces sp. NBC_01439]
MIRRSVRVAVRRGLWCGREEGLSPLKHRNLHLLGRYCVTASTPADGARRPLRDPDAPELDEGDNGQE